MPAKQPWWIWVNGSYDSRKKNKDLTTALQNTKQPMCLFYGLYTTFDRKNSNSPGSSLFSYDDPQLSPTWWGYKVACQRRDTAVVVLVLNITVILFLGRQRWGDVVHDNSKCMSKLFSMRISYWQNSTDFHWVEWTGIVLWRQRWL